MDRPARIPAARVRQRALLAALALLLGACASDAPAPPDLAQPRTLSLPGSAFFPESLSVASDGALYAGSVATGEVVRFAPGSPSAATLLAAGEASNTTGLYADRATATLYLCAVRFDGMPTELRAYDLDSGARRAAYPMPGFCNDLAVDGAGRLYVTDSWGGAIYRLDGGALAIWKSDAALQPAGPGGFGANGIAVVGAAVYVTNQDRGTLVRIAIEPDGSAGALTPVAVSPALAAPDCLRARADGSLVVTEALAAGAGRLTRVQLGGASASATVLAGGLRWPTSVVERDGSYLVAEGQLDELLKGFAMPPGTPMPQLPFLIQRVDAR